MDFLLNIPDILSFPNTCQMKCLPHLTYNLHLSQLYQPWGLSPPSPAPSEFHNSKCLLPSINTSRSQHLAPPL